MIRELKRRLDWFLTTDFDMHDSPPPHLAKAIAVVILLIIIVGGLHA